MPELPWESLFKPPPAPEFSVVRRGRLVRKQGRPLLFLPERPAAASVAVSLYPAQSATARIARALLRGLMRLRTPLGAQPAQLRLSTTDAFASFLRKCAGTPEVPEFAIMAGNPATPGTRFIILVFGQSGAPEAVVKAGSSPAAQQLVACEEQFLETASARFPGVPRFRAAFHDEKVRAFAMEYVYGTTPPARHIEEPAPVLGGWIHNGPQVRLGDLAAWQRLSATPAGLAAAGLNSLAVKPVVFHGDFAPWNVRVSSSGAWTVLDWERGALEGTPGWDWFHYVLQPAILVRHLRTSQLINLADSLLGSTAFREYAARTGIGGHERQLLKAYLGYCVHVLRPSEGLEATRELLLGLK